jgi:hypothetical protein
MSRSTGNAAERALVKRRRRANRPKFENEYSPR